MPLGQPQDALSGELDVASRLKWPAPHASDSHAFQAGGYQPIVQISTDGFSGYPEAVDLAFGPYARFGTIVKEYRNANMTYTPSVRAMRPRTRAAVLALPGVVPLAWPGAPKNFYRAWRELRTTARVDGGAMQRLRRSSASEVERVTPGAAAAFLGHATPGLAERCYIDPRIAGPRPVSPTRLE